MPSYTIANAAIPTQHLQTYYALAKSANGINLIPGTFDLDWIFEVAERDRSLFPNIKLTGTLDAQSYMVRWVKSYQDAMNRLPSERRANPKSACTDPAIRVIVQAAQGLTNLQAAQSERSHNLFMSAENIQGNLLEEYIAYKVRPYGFLWCAGNVLHATDFCNTTGSFLLQIKNKSNTENSSSSAIRANTPIQKWYRLGTRTQGGVKVPVYKWPDLNRIINDHKTDGYHLPPCAMSEDDYQAFLFRAASANHNLITDV